MQTQIEKEIMQFMKNFSKEYEEKEDSLKKTLEKFTKYLYQVSNNQKVIEENYSMIMTSYEIILKNYEYLNEKMRNI